MTKAYSLQLKQFEK